MRKAKPETPMIMTWKTDNAGVTASNQIQLPLTSLVKYDFVADWGDGTSDRITAWNDAVATHTYATSGTYTVKLKGSFPRFLFNGSTDKAKLLDITQWGSNRWVSMDMAFLGCINLQITAADAPNLKGVTTMTRMFSGATSFNSNISSWNISSVKYMDYMFLNASSFNQNISSWDTSAVISMEAVFTGAGSFNQNISAWNVSAVTNMNNMFNGASSFNQNISSWNVSAVTKMNYMFSGANAFNQNLTGWAVNPQVTTCTSFKSNPAFTLIPVFSNCTP